MNDTAPKSDQDFDKTYKLWEGTLGGFLAYVVELLDKNSTNGVGRDPYDIARFYKHESTYNPELIKLIPGTNDLRTRTVYEYPRVYRETEDELRTIIREIAEKRFLNKQRDDIKTNTLCDLMKTPAVLTLRIHFSGRVYIHSPVDLCFGDDAKDVGALPDTQALDKDLDEGNILGETGRYGVSSISTTTFVNNVECYMRRYNYRDFRKMIDKALADVFSANYKFCIRKGNIIVPDEYLEKGAEGIAQWVHLKTSTNKNNSLEKKLMKDLYNKKKEALRGYLYKVSGACENPTRHHYLLLHLTTVGGNNKQYMNRTISSIIKDFPKDKFCTLSDSELLQLAKDYMIELLHAATNNISALTP